MDSQSQFDFILWPTRLEVSATVALEVFASEGHSFSVSNLKVFLTLLYGLESEFHQNYTHISSLGLPEVHKSDLPQC